MSKIIRPNLDIKSFASNSSVGQRTIFGSTNENSNDLSKNLNDDLLKGWEVVTSSSYPPKQWFNGAMFTISELVSYLYQYGVSEWVKEQEYHTNSITSYGGRLYVSLVDNNVGNDVSDITKWLAVSGSSGSIMYAEDISTDANKILLNEYPNQYLTRYDDNVFVIFKLKISISSTNVTLNINNIGEKNINGLDLTSLTTNGFMFLKYDKANDYFIHIDIANKNYDTYEASNIDDLNNITNSCKIPIKSSNVKNSPSTSDGIVEVIKVEQDIYQKFIDREGLSHTRIFKDNSWSDWTTLVTDNYYSEFEKESTTYSFISLLHRNNNSNYIKGNFIYEVNDTGYKQAENAIRDIFDFRNDALSFASFCSAVSLSNGSSSITDNGFVVNFQLEYKSSVVTKTTFNLQSVTGIDVDDMLYPNLWAGVRLGFNFFNANINRRLAIRYIVYYNKKREIVYYWFIESDSTSRSDLRDDMYPLGTWFRNDYLIERSNSYLIAPSPVGDVITGKIFFKTVGFFF